MFNEDFAKYLINIYHMFNIILPKPCEIFAKFLLKICLNYLAKISQGFSTNTILVHSDRMIYFMENSNNSEKIMLDVTTDFNNT